MLRIFLRHKLLIVLAIAVTARVTALALFPGVFAFDQTGTIHGSDAYDAYAQNLNATGVYGREPGIGDARIPPLYSYALAGVYALFGRGYLQVGAFHIALDLASMLMVYAIAVRLTRPAVRDEARAEWVGTIAAFFYAVYPYLIFQNLTLIDTPFFMTLMLAFILSAVMLREQRRFDAATIILAIACGLILGAATLTRPILPFLAVFVGLWFLYRLPLGTTIVRLGIVAGTTLLVIAPWIVRSSAVYGVFVPISVSGGANLWQGNNASVVPYLQAGYDVQWTSPDLVSADPNSAEADSERVALAVQFWREHPDQLPELFWTKLLVHWSIDIAPRLNPTAGSAERPDYQGDVQVGEGGDLTLGGLPPGDPVDAYSTPLFDQIGRTVHRFYFGGLLVMALVGVALSWRAWREISLLWFVQIAMTVVYVVYHPSTRYRVPSDPLLFIFSALALVLAVEALGRRARRPARTIYALSAER